MPVANRCGERRGRDLADTGQAHQTLAGCIGDGDLPDMSIALINTLVEHGDLAQKSLDRAPPAG